MRVALIQFNATGDKQDNIKRSTNLVEEALKKEVKFVLLPEIFLWRGDGRTQDKFIVAENIPNVTTKLFCALAKKYQANILLGSILEKSKSEDKLYNTSVMINAQGEIVAKYRKIHLFDARLGCNIIKESDSFLAGRKKVISRVDIFQVGMSICYDVRFPDLYRHYAMQGANVMVVPSCFMKITGQAHWETLIRARAIESLAYVLAPNQVGTDGRGMMAYGNSLIVSPWGEVLARGSDTQEEIIVAEISMDAVQHARAQLPSLIRGE